MPQYRHADPGPLDHRNDAPPARFEPMEPRVLLAGGAVEASDIITTTWRGREMEAVQGSWIISFDEALGKERAEEQAMLVARRLGVTVLDVKAIGRGRWAEVTLSKSSRFFEPTADAVKGMVKSFTSIVPNGVSRLMAAPNDPRYAEQWFHDNTGQVFSGIPGVPGEDIDSTDAWDISTGSSGVIAVDMDTGVDLTHPDLVDNLWQNPGEIADNGIDDDGNGFIDDVFGWDFINNDNDPSDDNGHGTPVAGLIGAVGNNGIGVAGVNWQVSIMVLKAGHAFGFSTFDAQLGSFDYATMMAERGHNVAVLNFSFGGLGDAAFIDPDPGEDPIKDAIDAMGVAGITATFSAGNDGWDNDRTDFTNYPSSYTSSNIIAVAAMDHLGGLSGYSNYGPESVDIGAPADFTLSTTMGGGYGYFGGTSAASPVVAGVVALLKSVKPELTPEEVRQTLMSTVDIVPSLEGRVGSNGRVNAARAVGLPEGPIVSRVSPGPVVESVDEIVVTFNKDINAGLVSTSGVSLSRSGGDATFDNGNDIPLLVSSVTVTGPREVTIVPGSTLLTVDSYRVVLDDASFKDLAGNFLNGDSGGGRDERYVFRISTPVGAYESNDTLEEAEPANFTASGSATFNGARIGDGLHNLLDVDLFAVSIPRAGLITARVDARSLSTPSSLDSYLRLFSAAGTELASNDQFNGADSLIDYFVPGGGTFYIGVSGFGNDAYNPQIAASGSSQSIGEYNLTVSVELADDEFVVAESELNDDDVPPLDLPTSDTTSSIITVADGRRILDVNVRVDIAHTFVGDLRLSLVAPDGTTVILSNRHGSGGDNYTGTIFDDEAVTPIADGTPPYTGLFIPDEALSAFDDLSALGDWTLVIDDDRAGNGGQLLGWSIEFLLDNNIFGAFELNDTISLARDLSEVTSGLTATRDAEIGDGGYGSLDVDLYRFVATPGSTLTATVVPRDSTLPGGSTELGVNGALRLFDASGEQIKLADSPSSLRTTLTFVFSDGGTFYIGVSDGANTAYDPRVVASGTTSASSGDYTLTVSMVLGVSDGSLVVIGDEVRAGVDAGGALGARSTFGAATALRFDGVEFLADRGSTDPAVDAFVGVVASGFSFRNSSLLTDDGGLTELPMSVVDQSDASNRRVVVDGSFRGLRIQRTLSFGEQDEFIAVDVMLTNTSSSRLTGVAWMEGFNPNPGMNFGDNTPNTANDVLDGDPYVSATFASEFVPEEFRDEYTIALAAPRADDRALATVVGEFTTVRDPQQVLDQGVVDPDGAISNDRLALAFSLGTMEVGEVETFRYFILFGRSPDDAESLYAAVNDGTGTGHLAADPTAPASQTLQDGLDTPVPVLPYRLYYPEGFANDRASTFVPLLNPNEQAARVVVIARYEDATRGPRDQVLFDGLVQPNTRSPDGVTITTPAMYAAGTLLVRPDEPYAIEVHSSLPLGASFSHYDFGVSTGESFTSALSTAWSFAQGSKGLGSSDFVVFHNTSEFETTVRLTLYPSDGGEPIELERTVEGLRRGGFNLDAEPTVRSGVSYGITLDSDQPVVAALSSYNPSQGGGYGMLGLRGFGESVGASPEGQFGLSSESESITVLNASDTDAVVDFSFYDLDGSTYRTTLDVPAESRRDLDVGSLTGFPVGRAYMVAYESTVPVSVAQPTFSLDEAAGVAFADEAATYWAFAEGFRPPGGGVTEYLRVYNPSADTALVEITIHFTDGQFQVFRRTVTPRAANEIDVHGFISGDRLLSDQFYGLTLKSEIPVVAYLGHADQFFDGAFGTLGTSFGIVGSLS